MAPTAVIVLALLLGAALAALAVSARRGRRGPELAALRGELERLRQISEQSANLIAQLQGAQSAVQNSMNEVTRAVGDSSSRVAQQLQSSSADVNRHLSDVQQTFAGLQSKVGEMSEQARHLAELSRSIAGLENILSAPKLRGNFGETQLENLLSAVFAREQFQAKYRFPSGEVADAVLLFPQGLVAVDAKFPLENFRRMAAAATEAEKRSLRREFLRDVKRRIEEIASKYILPGEGTLPFALMYVPAENVYYEAIIRDEEGGDLYEYCAQKRVIPVSPNSLYAYLQTIVMGLNSLRVGERAESVLREIAGLQGQLEKFVEMYGKLGTHLRNAARSYEDSGRELEKVDEWVDSLAGNRRQQLPLIPEEKKTITSGE